MSANKKVEEILDNLKLFMGLIPKNLIGVDIGSSSIRACELQHGKNKYKLLKYFSEPLPEGTLLDEDINNEEEFQGALLSCVKLSKISSKFIAVALSGEGVIARKLQLPGGTDEELSDQVYFEAEQYIPFPIEDASISWHKFGENEGGGVDLLLVGAKEERIQRLQEIIENTGLKIKCVDIVVAAIINVFEHCYQERIDSENSWLIVEIGAQKTQLVVYRNGRIVFTKEINLGGQAVTEDLQRSMGVNFKEAEDLKITKDDNGNLPEEVIIVVNGVLNEIWAEIKKALDFYVSSTGDETIQECVVTGGSSALPGVISGLEELLGIPVNALNPFEKIEAGNFSPEEQKEIALKGIVAMGLAMRRLDE